MIDLSQLDKTIHEKGRLAIMSLLASRAQPWAFQHLKAELGLSDGNLITHLRTLEKYDYIMSKKNHGERSASKPLLDIKNRPNSI